MTIEYSLENATRFAWSSVVGILHPERVRYLERYLVGAKILDAGCGGGAYVDFLSNIGLSVTGVDLHDQFLQVARDSHRRGRFVQADLTNLPFSSRTFDTTYCFDVLEHVPDYAVLNELVRVTRKRLLLAVPREDSLLDKYNLVFAHHRDKTHLRAYTETSLHELLSKLPHREIQILPELPVYFESLIRELTTYRIDRIAPVEVMVLYLRIALREIRRLKRPEPRLWRDEALERCLKNLWAETTYPLLYAGLAAVVDLPE